MTSQLTEKMMYEGRKYAMCTEPMDSYFMLTGIFPAFSRNCTALWRGYIGDWEVLLDRLYLVKLDGQLATGEAISVAMYFPDYPERVFAHWYTGSVRLPQGERIEYVHMGYESKYEADLFLDFDRGHLIAKRLISNAPAKSGDGYPLGSQRKWD